MAKKKDSQKKWAELVARATGADYLEETTVGEFRFLSFCLMVENFLEFK